MTGAEQESWLLNGLAASGATWNVLAQQVFFAQRDFDTSAGELYAMDAWDGYLGSRNRIMNFIRDRRIRNPVVITGDVHNNWACNLKADFYNQRTATLGGRVRGYLGDLGRRRRGHEPQPAAGRLGEPAHQVL